MNSTKQKTKKDQPAAFVLHGQSEDGLTHFVGLGNLRVVLMDEGDHWFAQSLEIDYAAQGDSMDDVKKRFAVGLKKTIREHVKLYGSIEKLLDPAPANIWKELLLSGPTVKRYTQIAVHELNEEEVPFGNLEYLVAEPAA